ncbi:MAG TPA: efflux RND transporter periplasmic adaptor subunit [Acetobacteraceae bacterium]|nr:efflux RND transporter periplasmic adaptor subunit [Acetobacteraceae bacterium]
MLEEAETAELGEAEDGGSPSPAPRPRRRATVLYAVVGAVLLCLGIYLGIRARAAAEARLAQETSQQAVPIVQVVHPRQNAPDQELVLPGQTVAFTDTPIYARTNGYLKRWYFDIGAHVRQGQLLADIETPELDQQLRQARADLATAQANAKLASITAKRTANLLRTQSVSTQEHDNAAGTFAADQSTVASQAANVARLEELQSYEHVYAPFDGVITARNTDVGDLINAGAGSATTELFHMTADRTLRIYVAVPEMNAPDMHVGAAVAVTLDEYPGQQFPGTLVRTDHAINPASRTLLVEVDVNNPDGKLLPGAYVFAHFTLAGVTRAVTIPSNALLFRSEGLRVGVVRNGEAELTPIKIGRDYGDRVEVLSGLGPADQVIVNPSDSLVSGTKVRVAPGQPPGTG